MKRPNLIYILADDMGYGDISCLNSDSKIQTPHLDAVAKRGLVHTDAHSSSAVCTPSRYSILTGRYNWRTTLKRGVYNGYTSQPLIEKGRTTVASYLKEHGYRTGCIGKWHLGWNWAKSGEEPEDIAWDQPIEDGPTTVGFDTFYGIPASLDMAPYVYIENDLVTAAPDRHYEGASEKAFARSGPMGADFAIEDVLPNFTRRAVQWVEEAAEAGDPFFLYFPLPAPHTPILPTKEWQGKSGTNAYGDFCLMCDDLVGQLVSALERTDTLEDTILIFTSDNGCSPMANFEELAEVGHHPSYVFRGHKADIYEGGHRIPLVMQWPAGIPAGSSSGQTVCLADLLATMAEVCGKPLADHEGEDSVSNLAIWQGTQSEDDPVREATVHHSVNGSFSIRQGRWKLELCPGSGGWSHPTPSECEGLPPIQLYDLEEDIGERTNVYADHPEVVETLTNLLTSYVENGRSTPGKPQENTGAPFWDQLTWMKSPES